MDDYTGDLNYFRYLKLCRSKGNYFIRSPEVPKGIGKSVYFFPSYYRYTIFKQKICEEVYDGINMFPHITRYTISCRNEVATTVISLGLFEENADDGLNCMAKVFDIEDEECVTLNRTDIKNLYTYNRDIHSNSYDVDIFMIMLIRGGDIPDITISYY